MIIKGQNISSRTEKIIFRWGVFSAPYSLSLFRVLEDNNFGESKKKFFFILSYDTCINCHLSCSENWIL